MFGIGSTELLIILLVALIVLGPSKLAGASRKLGRALGEFRKVSNEFQRSLNVEAAKVEMRDKSRQRDNGSTTVAEYEDRKPGGSSDAKTLEMESSPPEQTPLEKAVANARTEAENAAAQKSGGRD